MNRIAYFQTVGTLSISCPPFSLRVFEITLTIGVCNVNCSGVGDESPTTNRQPECYAVEDDSHCQFRATSAHDGEQGLLGQGQGGRRTEEPSPGQGADPARGRGDNSGDGIEARRGQRRLDRCAARRSCRRQGHSPSDDAVNPSADAGGHEEDSRNNPTGRRCGNTEVDVPVEGGDEGCLKSRQHRGRRRRQRRRRAGKTSDNGRSY